MGLKQQYNSVTKKVAYVAANKTVQIAYHCPYCTLPDSLFVTFNGVRKCSDNSLLELEGVQITLVYNPNCASYWEVGCMWVGYYGSPIVYTITYAVYYIPDTDDYTWLAIRAGDDCADEESHFFYQNNGTNCEIGELANQYTDPPCSTAGYGGTGTVVNPLV